MSVINGEIVVNPPYGIDVNEVASELGEGTTDVGKLCTSTNIHKWSKYKPFDYNAIGFANQAAHLAALRSKDCGFTMTAYRNPTACLDEAITHGLGWVAWTYNPPRGGINTSPYRLFDFRNYNKLMGIPFNYGIMPQFVTTLTRQPDFENIDSRITNIAQEDLLGTEVNCPNLSSYKIGVAWRKQGQTGVCLAQTIDVSSTTWRNYLDYAKYDVCAFFSPISITARDNQTDGTYYLCPVPLSTFEKSAGTGMLVNGDINAAWVALSGTIRSQIGPYTTPKVEIITTNPNVTKTVLTNVRITDEPMSFGFSQPGTEFSESTTWTARIWRDSSTYGDQPFNPRYSPIL